MNRNEIRDFANRDWEQSSKFDRSHRQSGALLHVQSQPVLQKHTIEPTFYRTQHQDH